MREALALPCVATTSNFRAGEVEDGRVCDAIDAALWLCAQGRIAQIPVVSSQMHAFSKTCELANYK